MNLILCVKNLVATLRSLYIFNSDITDDEILMAVRPMKKGKTAGPDEVIHEFVIYGIDVYPTNKEMHTVRFVKLQPIKNC